MYLHCLYYSSGEIRKVRELVSIDMRESRSLELLRNYLERRRHLTGNATRTSSRSSSWQIVYVECLQKLVCDGGSLSAQQLTLLDQKLRGIEASNGVHKRWKPEDESYIHWMRILSESRFAVATTLMEKAVYEVRHLKALFHRREVLQSFVNVVCTHCICTL